MHKWQGLIITTGSHVACLQPEEQDAVWMAAHNREPYTTSAGPRAMGFKGVLYAPVSHSGQAILTKR